MSDNRPPREQRVYLAKWIAEWRDSLLDLTEGMASEPPPTLDPGEAFVQAMLRLREAEFWLGEALVEAAGRTGERGFTLFTGPDAAAEHVESLPWAEARGGESE